jgi:NitT/TauT family transport system ATP-binding protein
MGPGGEQVAAVSGLSVSISAKRFGGHLVLDAIQFDIPAGERVALLGASGLGKSTLLSLISGADPAFDGNITLPEGRVAMVFQAPRLLPWRTLAENVALIPGAGGLSRARELLVSVGLADAADKHPEKVSLGMQRRAALARAIAVEPALILMDEPLVSLDPASATEMRRLLTVTMDRTGAAALIATHDRREALALADRVLMMEGPPARLADDRRSPLNRIARRDPLAVDGLHTEWFGSNV